MNIFRIITYTGWLNPTLNYWFPDDEKTHTKVIDFFGISLGSTLLVGLVPGAIIDFFGDNNLILSTVNSVVVNSMVTVKSVVGFFAEQKTTLLTAT